MSILRRNAPFLNLGQRALDLVIFLSITWMIGKRYGSVELMRILSIYGSLLLIVIFSLFSVYKSWRGAFLSTQIRNLLLAWGTVLIVLNVLTLLLSNERQLAALWPFCLFKSPEFVTWSLSVFLGLVAVRVVVRLSLLVARERGYNQRSAVIAGAGEAGKRVAQYIEKTRWMGIRLVGFFDDGYQEGDEVRTGPTTAGTVLGGIGDCPRFCLDKSIDLVFIALPMSAEREINGLIWGLGTRGVNVFMVPDLFSIGIQKSRIHQLGEMYFMDLNLYPSWKRTFDILFSLAVILMTLPVWLMIMALIKIEDGGPVFYRHTRVMESGKQFGCFKFRTMHLNAEERLGKILKSDPALRKEWDRKYKLKEDPRVTKVGKFLRRTSLDELPQFLNVLAGQMSVVGARPVVPDELQKYYRECALTYCATKPGITGPWQCGKRSETEDYSERVALDSWYVLNCSLRVDVGIIFRTLWSVFSGKGAY